jgi:hypothetical protein
MADRKSPTLDLAVLCDSIDYDSEHRPFSLNAPLHTVLIEPDEQGKLSAPELMLYVQMTDDEAQGTFRFRVQVRSGTNIVLNDFPASGLEVSFQSHLYPVAPFEHVFVLRGLVFPMPGVYHFHVMSGHASLSDRENSARPAKLRVIAAERPGGGS